MTTSGLPFDDIRNLARQLPSLDGMGGQGGMDGLQALAAWLAAVRGHAPARVTRPVVALFAGTHAVVRHQGIEEPAAAVRAGVEAIAAGAAPISHLCAAGGLGLNVFDLALDVPVGDITEEAALNERDAAATMAFGMEAVALGADLLCLGAVGGSSDLPAKAVLSALGGIEGEAWGEDGVLIGKALRHHAGHLADPLEALRRLGGREIAALAGAILAARTQKVAVLLDGLPAMAAAAVLHALNPASLAHCRVADVHGEPHGQVAARLGLPPLLALGTGGHDGTGAALAAGLMKAAGEVAFGMAEVKRRRAG